LHGPGRRSRAETEKRCPKKRSKAVSLPILEPDAAGVDIGATQVFVAVPPERDPDTVRCFNTFTADLEKLADWL
jgi:transposase